MFSTADVSEQSLGHPTKDYGYSRLMHQEVGHHQPSIVTQQQQQPQSNQPPLLHMNSYVSRDRTTSNSFHSKFLESRSQILPIQRSTSVPSQHSSPSYNGSNNNNTIIPPYSHYNTTKPAYVEADSNGWYNSASSPLYHSAPESIQGWHPNQPGNYAANGEGEFRNRIVHLCFCL